MKHLVTIAVIVMLGFASPASHATSYSTDQSDLWFIPAESGWGIQFVQRDTLIFATMFVYDASGNPTWFVATMAPTAPNALAWSGDLYTTHGTYFGTPFNPASFGGSIVGKMNWTPQSVTNGGLTYSVNGIAVTKAITRQTIVNENYGGRFAGGLHVARSNCFSPSNNGTSEEADVVTVSQSGNNVTFTTTPLTAGTAACTYVGALTQFGQMGQIDGTYSCANGISGTFDAFEMQVTLVGITGRFVSTAPSLGCSGSGWFGGVRTTLF